jgi:hypothetical protein
MKIALISFHKNIGRYPSEWIDIYRNSIENQTFKNFDIVELNYGGGEERIFNGSIFHSINLKDHAQAHNYLLDICFSDGYDMVLNSNVDDKYPLDRIQIQVENFDPEVEVMSGNYVSFDEEKDTIHSTQFHNMNIEEEFKRNHNIIAHPACSYSRKFIEHNEKLISKEIASDDFCMWKRLLEKGARFKILPSVLMYYRISNIKTKA